MESKSKNGKDFGGFNFGTEDKILRWLHRGDTIYDVIVPEDAEVILCDEEKGIYRANKIMVTNPRKLTKELIIDYYKKQHYQIIFLLNVYILCYGNKCLMLVNI